MRLLTLKNGRRSEMSRRTITIVWVMGLFLLMLVNVMPASAYVTPQIGGGKVGMMDAPMIMPEITVVGTNVVVKDMMGMDWMTLMGNNRPVMRHLTGTDTLDPSKPWYTPLNGMDWNWQYGWSNAMFTQSSIPADCNIFIQVLNQSPGLSTYDRTTNSYAPIFGTNMSSDTWMWNDDISMSHNAYVVTPAYGEWSATYKIYLGNSITKAPIAGWGFDTVTLTWTSIPEPATLGLLGTGAVCLLHRKGRRRDI
jgi:hypothetical protein